MSGAKGGSGPFNPRVVLGLLLFGALVFIALLWFIGKGMTGNDPGNSGSHVTGVGLDGYAAFSRYLKQQGIVVKQVRSEGGLEAPGLLVLTPPHNADPAKLKQIVEGRRTIGPTLVITPKWQAMPAKLLNPAAKPGWVLLNRAEVPNWPGFQDDIAVDIAPMRAGGAVAAWRGAGLGGALPNSEFVMSGRSKNIVPLVAGSVDGRALAGYLQDEGYYPALEALAVGVEPPAGGDDDSLYPLIFVFEPDLINNYGFADQENAQLAAALVRAAIADHREPVSFDLTLNGYSSGSNLLTLAFKPPFLAATLSLILAALAVGWRAFNRFGPPRATTRAIAFGKRALVSNAAALVRRSKRLHLVGAPYADATRDRLARALALPTRGDAAITEAAIDRALAARAPGRTPFSVLVARLHGATRSSDILHTAQDIHALERTLTQ
jgi:hypothetical protein